MSQAIEDEASAMPPLSTGEGRGEGRARASLSYSSPHASPLPEGEGTRTVTLVAVAMLVALAAPALFGLVFTADDLGAFHLPLRAFYARALAGGDAFDWCPSLYSGFYLTGEGQVGTYHPLHWMLYRWLPLTWAWNFECLIAYPFMLAGIYALLRRNGLRPAASLFGGIVCTFCGFNLLHFVHVNAVAVIAHLPWLLYGITRLKSSRPDWQSVPRGRQAISPLLLISTLTGSQLLLGYPQYVLYSLIAETVYLIYLSFERDSGSGRRRNFQIASVWCAGKGLGLCLAAVQILPTLEALGDSVRQTVESSFSGTGSLHPLNAVQLVAPYLFTTRVVGQNTHELTFYVGVVPLLLAMIAFANLRQLKTQPALRRLAGLAVLLIVVGALVAMGKYSPIHRLTTAIPILSYVRFPCRATVLVQLGLGLLAAIGFALVSGSVWMPTVRVPRRTLVLLALISFALAAAAPSLWPEHTAATWLVWTGPMLLIAATLLVVRAASGSRIAVHGLVLLAAIDLGAYGLSYAAYREVERLDDYIAQTRVPSSVAGGRVALDLASTKSEGTRAGNQILLRGYSRIDGYAGLEPARSLNYRQPGALRVAGVSAVGSEAPVNGRSELVSDADGWLILPDASPRARLVRRFTPTEDPAHDIVSNDVEDTVLVQQEDRATIEAHVRTNGPSTKETGTAHAAIDRPGQMDVEAECSGPAILILTESYHSGWTVTIDGHPQRPLRLNGDFLGCLVPAGRSTVEFRFAPASLHYGRLVSVCGLGLMVMLLAASRLPRFRGRQEP